MWLKLAVWKILEAFFRAADANIFFDEVVVRLDVLITERPVFAESIVRRTFEIEITKAERNSAPNICAAPGHAYAAHPKKRLILRRRVRLFEVVRKPIGGVFVADIKDGLHWSRLADDFPSHIAIFQEECRFVLGKIGVQLRTACFEKSDL